MVEVIKFIFQEPFRLFFLAVIVWLMFPLWRTKCNCDCNHKQNDTEEK